MSMMPPRGPRLLNFFFAPTDPTAMGFLRIVAGCLVLYTHLSYSFDLSNFFGEFGWYGHKYVERERKEAPHFIPAPAWEDPYEPFRTAQIPEVPHRRKVIMANLRSMLAPGATAADVDARMAYLDKLLTVELDEIRRRFGDGLVGYRGIAYVSGLAEEPADRANQLAVLADESLREAKRKARVPELPLSPSPDAVSLMSPAERAAFAQDAETYYRSLPTNPDDRAVVLTHLGEMDYGQRRAWVNFVKRVGKLDDAERAKQLNYFEYWNVDPSIVSRAGIPIFSLWFHVTDPAEMRAAHGAMLVVFLLFTLGLFTRVTSVLTWLAALTYIHRSQQILFGMDTMMNVTLIYLMISNCGAALSLDRLLNRYKAARLSLTRTGTIDPATRAYLDAPPLSVTTGLAQRLLQMHFCVIYLASGLAKLKGPAWWNTNAFWDTMVNPEFTMIYYQWYEGLIRALVSNRPVYAAMAAGGVIFTFVVEIGFPFVVWTRLRPYAVTLGLALHFGIGLFMGLIVFSLFMMAMLLAFLPGAAIRGRLFGPPSTARRAVTYDPTDARQSHRLALLFAADFDGTLVPQPQANSGKPIELEGGASPASVGRGWQRLLGALTFLPRRAGFLPT